MRFYDMPAMICFFTFYQSFIALCYSSPPLFPLHVYYSLYSSSTIYDIELSTITLRRQHISDE